PATGARSASAGSPVAARRSRRGTPSPIPAASASPVPTFVCRVAAPWSGPSRRCQRCCSCRLPSHQRLNRPEQPAQGALEGTGLVAHHVADVVIGAKRRSHADDRAGLVVLPGDDEALGGEVVNLRIGVGGGHGWSSTCFA